MAHSFLCDLYMDCCFRFLKKSYVVGAKPTTSELAGEKPFLATDWHITLPSSINAQNIQSDGIVSLAVSGETQTDEEKEKGTQSPSYCDDKSAYSSMVCFFLKF